MLEFIATEVERNKTEALDESTITNLLAQVKTSQSDIFEIHKRISLTQPADMVPHVVVFKELLTQSNKLLSALVSIKNRLPQTSATNSRVNKGNSKSLADIRLPIIDLPTFDGNIHEWVTFRDIFNNAIHENTNISNAQKLTYLKSQLKGEAARQIHSLIISDANYTIAWDLLKERYQNERQILFAVLKRLTDQQQASNSSSSLRSLIDKSKECIRSLESLNQPVDSWNPILLFHIYQKLDNQSKELYEYGLKDSNIPTVESLFEFLEQRSRALEASSSIKFIQKPNIFQKQEKKVHIANSSLKCKICEESHYLYRCEKFLEKTPEKRNEVAKKLNLCFNCLKDNHPVSKCFSKSSCRSCNKRHNTLLHIESKQAANNDKQAIEAANNDKQSKLNFHANNSTNESQTILATAIIHVKDKYGQYQAVRVLLDGGADTHIINISCIRRLGFSWRKTNATITGLSSIPIGSARGILDIDFNPHFDKSLTFTAKGVLIMNSITQNLPIHPCNSNINHLRGLQLADKYWYQPMQIDMLIGASVFYEILNGEKKKGRQGQPIALNSSLGWLVAGDIFNQDLSKQSTNYHAIHSKNSFQVSRIHTTIKAQNVDLDKTLRQFWEIESTPNQQKFTPEEQACEEHFLNTYTRNDEGRFIVRLPFKQKKSNLGESRHIAIHRYQQIERRLNKMPQCKDEYHSFIKEYLELGHMEKIPENEIDSSNTCYIPHHFVLKETSSTTKLRVVFDASAKTSNGTSLNSMLMVGPTVQDNLIDLILRFRLHKIAFTADLEKMYRQVNVHKEDTNFQRIVWRENTNQPMQDYRLLTVTYGTAPAPYLATRALQELARSQKANFPLAAPIVEKDFYVDDLMSGGTSVENALEIQSQIIQLVKSGGMNLRKWTSNHSALISHLHTDLIETKSILPMEYDHTIKTLGIYWQPNLDVFLFKIDINNNHDETLTKRIVLSEIAKIFDPIGWLAPIIITAKLLMQRLWTLTQDWDEPLPLEIQSQWQDYKSELIHIQKIRIPRFIMPAINECKIALIGFCDSSEKAYAAVAYLCIYPNHSSSSPSISLVASKTRVAPLKPLSLPRLELCGALLLSNLIDSIKSSLNISFDHISAWSDSTITLYWIKSHPSRWNKFVGNRAAEIQSKIPAELWGHVAGLENPADCASRGLHSHTLTHFNLWWNGPEWLKKGIPMLNQSLNVENEQILKEERVIKVCNKISSLTIFPFISSFSSLTKLKRVTAWLFRFYSNCKSKINNKKQANDNNSLLFGPLSTSELRRAFLILIKSTQQQEFQNEFSCLQEKKAMKNNSKLLSLCPFIDEDGILRVGGRLQHAPISMNKKHPILLPYRSSLTALIIQNEHLRNIHAGAQLVISSLQNQFWIIRCRDAVKQQIRKCVPCTKLKSTTMTQMMAALPSFRVTPARAFERCGVDYAGFFLIRPISPKSKITLKSYLSIFVCSVTRAVHLEIVSSLSTEAFIAALRRFIARRGHPTDIYSDNGTNFTGAEKELRLLLKQLQHNEVVSNELSTKGIQWHFNPPHSPHFGGLWEAGVKSVKFHLKHIIGNHRLTFEELSTVTAQIEAILNSRPLTPESSDPNDMSALTPGHFLIGCPLIAAPDPDLTKINTNKLSRWQLLQQFNQFFWKRWSSEYITRLQQRPKWMTQQKQIQVNDMVIIKEDNSPPMNWKLGRIIQLYPGSDGLTRVVSIKTSTGIIKRPIVKLCVLPIESE